MKQIMVTGATGFIGRHLTEHLLRNGDYCVTAIVRRGFDPGKLPQLTGCAGRMEVLELDLKEYGRIPELAKTAVDAYFALAWDGTRGKDRHDEQLQMENYRYSMEGIRAACSMGCRKIFTAGSQAEYGRMQGITSENAQCIPETAYGKAKLRLCMDAAGYCLENGVSFFEPRFFSLYGEDDNPKTMLLSVLKAMLENKPCRMTSCVQDWDFLHIEDAVRGLRMLLEGEHPDGIYNFASGDTRMLKDFVEEMYRITRSRSRLEYGAVPYPPEGMVSMRPSVDKLKRETGWRAEVSFSEGIRRIIKRGREEGLG